MIRLAALIAEFGADFLAQFRHRLRGCENIPPSPPASVARPV
jgi:hypothetical protein